MGLIKIGFDYASLNMNMMMYVKSTRERETKVFNKLDRAFGRTSLIKDLITLN